jgi:hypothetical protein
VVAQDGVVRWHIRGGRVNVKLERDDVALVVICQQRVQQALQRYRSVECNDLCGPQRETERKVRTERETHAHKSA